MKFRAELNSIRKKSSSEEEIEVIDKEKQSSRRLKVLLNRSDSNSSSKSSKKEKRTHKEASRIGSSMNEITIRRVSVGVMVAIILTFLLTYVEHKTADSLTVVSLHNSMVLLQNSAKSGVDDSLTEYGGDLTAIARLSSTPSLCSYQFISENGNYSVQYCEKTYLERMHNREKFRISVCSAKDPNGDNCIGPRSSSLFAAKTVGGEAVVLILFQIFVILIGCLGLICFAGPVTTLVVTPIERMIRLLSMLVKDPLGYTKTKKYRTFMNENNERSLNGMETSFLLSTLLRIGVYINSIRIHS